MSAFGKATATPDDETWLPIADLMAGLMIVFLFIAVIYIRPVINREAEVREVAVAFDRAEARIVAALEAEFAGDLARWDAEIDPEALIVRFKAPDVLFRQGDAALQARFEAILDDFFPRYASILAGYAEHVEEVRIEGHTSSDWAAGSNADEAFFGNMALSQARTRAVLAHALSTVEDEARRDWLRTVVTANGLSSSRPVMTEGADGAEDRARSRRVEFRVRTDAKRQMVRILETLE